MDSEAIYNRITELEEVIAWFLKYTKHEVDSATSHYYEGREKLAAALSEQEEKDGS